MDNFIKKMDQAMVQLCNYGMSVDKKHRHYGTDFEIAPKEIHLLEAVGNHPGLNSTELAARLGLQKGTFSKISRNLEKKGFLRVYQDEYNRKEIYFKLTELGQKAYDGHYSFHQRRSEKTYEYFSHYSRYEQKVIMEFIDRYTKYLKEYVDN